ncbi:MAG: pilus assembly protein PilM [Patescibacteria group bacterium]|jgi:type IV pilus assembly protein PilM
MFLPFSENSIVGLDIGFETLKLVELNKGGGKVSLRGLSNISLPERILERDHFKDKKATAQLIAKACEEAKPASIKARKIVSALPETFVFSKTIQLPKMEEGEYEKAVPMEAAQFLPIPIEHVYLDFEVLITRPDQPLADILIVASPKRLVEEYVEVAQLAGFELTALEPKALAVGRALLPHDFTEGVLIAEIGTEITRISIWDGNKLRLTTTVSAGNNQIAESTKAGDFHHLLPIIDEVVTAIRYHQNRDYQPKPISKILLCGSGACIPGIDKIFENESKIKVEIARPQLHGEDELGPEYTTAFGLALRGEYE